MKPHMIILTLLSTSAFGQFIGEDPVEEKNLRPWTAKTISEYQGVYDFGFSEMESVLCLTDLEKSNIRRIKEFEGL